MAIRDLFASDVTRDIPPVVYFHEQSPEKLAAEVSEYIITGGWPEGHPNHRRVPNGIHEQYVRLLTGIVGELGKPHGPDLPNCWISGFYGSGKSSFAKLLGLALDGVELPDGTSLAAQLLKRDTSPRKSEFETAWTELRKAIDPIAVVFDVGGVARDNEHIHSVVLRRLQVRLGYCATQPLVADHELNLERDGLWGAFLAKAEETLGKPWDEAKSGFLAGEDFSQVMHALDPEKYTDPMAWYMSRAGTHTRAESPEEAVAAIRDMLKFRSPGSTLFLVIDEVSQYVLVNSDRAERLRAFATSLGSKLKGRVWLMALGQQTLDEGADDSFLLGLKDRFPPRLRVHLAATNIRDVVHKRLLHKTGAADTQLREMFEKNRANLKLFAYGCDTATPDEFVETYPMLPGHIGLVLQLTSALRARSNRMQGDDHNIRGLLQLLGELFRARKLADQDVGTLVTLDQVYEIQQTALDSDVQTSMARILDHCADDGSEWMMRAAKAVALLELIQDTVPTDAKLVAQCLYDRVDRGSILTEVTDALEALRRNNLLGYSEKHGYKIQSSAGEEWERERREISVPGERISELVQGALGYLLATPVNPRYQGRPFPWAGVYSDGRRAEDAILKDPRDDAAVRVDFRFVRQDEPAASAWIKRSDETALRNRLVWVCGDTTDIESQARQLARSQAMVRKFKPRRESLNAARRMLLQQEENRVEDLELRFRESVSAGFMAGEIYFRGRSMQPRDHGTAFAGTLESAGKRILPELFPHFVATNVTPKELEPLLAAELAGPSPKFLTGDASAGHLGILELDSGRYVPACSGVVPRRVLEFVEQEGGVGGTTLLAEFGGPPYGYTTNVVRACVIGLLRAGKLRIQPESGVEITAVRDAGVRDIFSGDRSFRRATFFPAGDDDIGVQGRARVCKFFKQELGVALDREDTAIADAVADHFPAQAARLREVVTRMDRLPVDVEVPETLQKLQTALEACLRHVRQTKPTVRTVKAKLDVLREGTRTLAAFDTELTEEAIRSLRQAANTREHQVGQLREVNRLADASEAAGRIDQHLDSARPWQAIATLESDLQAVRDVYVAVRTELLQTQERLAEEARGRVKAFPDFSKLSGDKSYHVLRPIQEATDTTDAEAVAPALSALDAGFQVRLRDAEAEALERLDEIRSAGDQPMVKKVAHQLRNREVCTEAELDAALAELKQRVLEHLTAGSCVRLV